MVITKYLYLLFQHKNCIEVLFPYFMVEEDEYIEGLQSRDPHVRRNAAISLQGYIRALDGIADEMRRKNVIDALLGALKDVEGDVRLFATEALEDCREERIVEPLIGLLIDDDIQVAWKAAEILCYIGDERAYESLIELYLSPKARDYYGLDEIGKLGSKIQKYFDSDLFAPAVLKACGVS
jgi:HEAT repeat protein